ncbi:uncharacterized protein LOC112139296 [Oryzias melastigma]|uniref:uncharacterized protein LOC112139296 n=1 Tax=Oryzias melastigma TaxID=30732 RepID=UPI00168CE34E|nr:uncharacterized protein LOC112139296 [Oryzias melastigma]
MTSFGCHTRSPGSENASSRQEVGPRGGGLLSGGGSRVLCPVTFAVNLHFRCFGFVVFIAAPATSVQKMEEELRELRSLVAQLKADNDRLRQEQVLPEPRAGPSVEVAMDSPPVASGPLTERLIFVPRDRRCPTFSGTSSLSLDEWLEEVQACSRARHLSRSEQAFFMFDHLEGEALAEIKFRPSAERSDPVKIISVLQELYGCSQSYVSLQEAFFSRKQQDGESLLEFSLALMSLMERVKQQSPYLMTNAESLLRDQFAEHVLDSSLRRELKKMG